MASCRLAQHFSSQHPVTQPSIVSVPSADKKNWGIRLSKTRTLVQNMCCVYYIYCTYLQILVYHKNRFRSSSVAKRTNYFWDLRDISKNLGSCVAQEDGFPSLWQERLMCPRRFASLRSDFTSSKVWMSDLPKRVPCHLQVSETRFQMVSLPAATLIWDATKRNQSTMGCAQMLCLQPIIARISSIS